MPKQTPNIITILGPTATGKTRLAVHIAAHVGGEIISADSRQVYVGMNIGTGKDLDEYVIDKRQIPYHMIDIIKPETNFSVFDFQKAFYCRFAEIGARGAFPVLAGGTGLYIDSVLRGYELIETPENPTLRAELSSLSMDDLEKRLRLLTDKLHNVSDLQSRQKTIRTIEIHEYKKSHPEICSKPRPTIRSLNIGTLIERDENRQRIRKRLRERIETGMIDEARTLRSAGLAWERFAYFGLEYKFLALHLQGELSRDEMEERLAMQIGRFAKRQRTWFRRMERHGVKIHWLAPGDFDGAMTLIRQAGIA
jgi:tRNA dimethylallyltransferase